MLPSTVNVPLIIIADCAVGLITGNEFSINNPGYNLPRNREPSYFQVLVSTDYSGDATSCTWESLTVPTWSDGSTWDFVNVGIIDLSKYSNKSIVIAFKYKSDENAAATWEFKNIRVIEESVITGE